MKVVKKEKQTKEVEVTVECYEICDKCNEKIEKDAGDAFEFDFLHKTGSTYPEGGAGEQQEMDLCKICAEDLVSRLREMGYRISDSEWDY